MWLGFHLELLGLGDAAPATARLGLRWSDVLGGFGLVGSLGLVGHLHALLAKLAADPFGFGLGLGREFL